MPLPFPSPFFPRAALLRRGWSVPHASARFLHEGPDTIDEILDRHLTKKTPSSSDEVEDPRRRPTNSRREALSLYRDVLRATRFFPWPDSRGVPWRDVLRANARREFEEARHERDPEVVTRLLIGGRDAVEKALERLAERFRREAEGKAGDGSGRW